MLHGAAIVMEHLIRPGLDEETRFHVRLIRRHRPRRFFLLPSLSGRKIPPMQGISSPQEPEAITVTPGIPADLPESPHGVVLPVGRSDTFTERLGGRPDEIILETPPLSSLEEIKVEAFRRKLEARKQNRWLQLVDADTTDEESWRKRYAQQIVDEAIAAMGGLKALTGIRDMQIRKKIKYWLVIANPAGGEPWVDAAPSYLLEAEYEHKRPYKYRERTRTKTMTGYDGEIGWRSGYGRARQLEGEELLRVKVKAERWDFLSQFKGDGISLRYISEEEFTEATYQHSPEPVHIIEVNDMKYGDQQYAVFDRQSHLLTAMVNPLGSKKIPPPIWITRYSDYRKVGEILFPHATHRYNAQSIGPSEHVSLGFRWRYGRGGGFRTYEITYNTGLRDDLFRLPIDATTSKTSRPDPHRPRP